MPKTKINYSKTIFYRIVCNDVNITDCYVGHTTNFIKRKQLHKSCCNKENNKSYNLKVYQIIRDNGGWVNWSMIMIKEHDCNDINDALRQERLYLEEYKATLNYNIPSRTKQEYESVYKNKRKENNEINKDKIKNQQKEYYINNINKINEYITQNKDKIKNQKKEWYIKNKDKIKNQQKELYIKNKDIIKKSEIVV